MPDNADPMKTEYPPIPDPENCFWRVGHSVGRTLYAIRELPLRDEKGDVLIGMMDSRALASAAVEAHNRDLMIRNAR